MTKKRGFRKLIALCLAAVMILTMCVPALAAIDAGEKGTITVTGVEGSGKITAYKVIDINFDTTDQQPEEPIYTWNDAVKGWVEKNYSNYIDSTTGEVTSAFQELKSADKTNEGSEIKAFVDDLANALRSTNVDGIASAKLEKLGSKTWSTATNASITYDNVPMGAYILLVEDGVKIYSPGFAQVYPEYKNDEWSLANGTVSVELKSKEPGIVKSVSADDQAVAIGDTVTFTLTIDVPQYPADAINKKFVFGDKLPEGLTFVEDSVSIKCGEIDLGNYFTKATNTNSTFEYVLKNDDTYNYDAFVNKLNENTAITVTYQAKVNQNAVSNGTIAKDNLKNKAYLNYNNNPYTSDGSKEQTDDEQLYTYKLKIKKVDADEKTLLKGAQFKLKKGDAEISFVKDTTNNIYQVADATETTATTTVLETNEQGFIQMIGLDANVTYTLTEIKAPGDYPLPANPDVTITLTDNKTADGKEGIDGDLDSVTAESKGDLIPDEADKNNSRYVTVEGSDKSMAIVTIQNSKHAFHLPVTGGTGTLIFSLIGVAVMGTAVAMVVIVRKKRA